MSIHHFALVASLFAAGLAHGETAPDPHAGHQMAEPALTGTETAATLAYRQANAAMHSGMAIPYTGDADVDFIAGMIPHHQGAVEMAKIVLEHGTDPEVRKLAEAVIATQEVEIAWMQDWLAQHGQ